MRNTKKNKNKFWIAKKKFISNSIEGISLIEGIISITIISVGFLSAVALTVSNIKASSYANNKFIALSLAWEGTEAVRNIRDSNWLNKDLNWDDNIYSITDNTAILVFDKSLNRLNLDFSVDNMDEFYATVYKNKKSGEYIQGYNSFLPTNQWEKTIFKRLIYIDKTDKQALKVRSVVKFKNKPKNWQTVQAQTLLYNWK
jgi:hypothetical protein